MALIKIKTKKPLKTVYCYAHKDKVLRDELGKHLNNLKRQGYITDWYDHDILPGTDWAKEIDTQLRSSHLILLLVSPDFMASDCAPRRCI